jgi:hypothetical protein
MTLYLDDDCLFCIDGNMPAGIHDVLGPVYGPCPECLIVCDNCDGEGLFPADYDCPQCLTTILSGLGLAAILCGHCLGVVDLIPANFAVPPEAPGYDHNHE